jgi:hypothetical protein
MGLILNRPLEALRGLTQPKWSHLRKPRPDVRRQISRDLQPKASALRNCSIASGAKGRRFKSCRARWLRSPGKRSESRHARSVKNHECGPRRPAAEPRAGGGRLGFEPPAASSSAWNSSISRNVRVGPPLEVEATPEARLGWRCSTRSDPRSPGQGSTIPNFTFDPDLTPVVRSRRRGDSLVRPSPVMEHEHPCPHSTRGIDRPGARPGSSWRRRPRYHRRSDRSCLSRTRPERRAPDASLPLRFARTVLVPFGP